MIIEPITITKFQDHANEKYILGIGANTYKDYFVQAMNELEKPVVYALYAEIIRILDINKAIANYTNDHKLAIDSIKEKDKISDIYGRFLFDHDM